jgi:Protein of unknown function (DUF2934)
MRPRLQKMPREPQPEQPKPVPIGEPVVTESELRQMISEAAYYLAERRGFTPGYESDDWRQAEQEVLARVRESQSRI